jgi:hypothetical protein
LCELRTAIRVDPRGKALGLTIPVSFLQHADEVIE